MEFFYVPTRTLLSMLTAMLTGTHVLSHAVLSAPMLFFLAPLRFHGKRRNKTQSRSAEAEYRSIAYALKELKWIKKLLVAFGVDHPSLMRLHCDSKSAIYIAANPVFHEPTKHIESDCHVVRDAVLAKLITTEHISTKEQPADILTKALPSTTFSYLLSKLAIQDLSPPT